MVLFKTRKISCSIFTLRFLGELENTILVAVYEPLKNSHACKVANLHKEFRHAGNGMVFKKRWAYTKLFNYHFSKVRDISLSENMSYLILTLISAP